MNAQSAAILMIFIVGIVVILLILKNKNFLKFDTTTTTTTTTTSKVTTAAPAVGPTAKIYPDAADPHLYTTTTDGELEQDGDRKEPQLVSGFNYLNTEATIYINYHGINDTLSIKLRGPKHSGIPDSDMCNNIHYCNLGSGGNQAFGKQWGHTEVYCEFGDTQVSIPENVWVGVKAIEWNDPAGGVHFQTWLENPEGSGWQLAADAVDSGSAGDCTGGAADPYLESPCASDSVSIGFRVDGLSGGGDVEFKDASVREIAVPPAALQTAPAAGARRAIRKRPKQATNILDHKYKIANVV